MRKNLVNLATYGVLAAAAFGSWLLPDDLGLPRAAGSGSGPAIAAVSDLTPPASSGPDAALALRLDEDADIPAGLRRAGRD